MRSLDIIRRKANMEEKLAGFLNKLHNDVLYNRKKRAHRLGGSEVYKSKHQRPQSELNLSSIYKCQSCVPSSVVLPNFKGS